MPLSRLSRLRAGLQRTVIMGAGQWPPVSEAIFPSEAVRYPMKGAALLPAEVRQPGGEQTTLKVFQVSLLLFKKISNKPSNCYFICSFFLHYFTTCNRKLY